VRQADDEPHRNDWLTRAFDALGRREYAALVCCDSELIAIHREGQLAENISLGESICLTVAPLFGMEEEIKSLRLQSDSWLEIPTVAIVSNGAPTRRLNYLVLWDSPTDQFVLFLARSLAANDMAVELRREVRQRMLVEAEVAAQALEIEAANRVLMRVNRDLADFARIVSHDLKSPMRAMRYFTDDLEQSLLNPVEDDPKTHLDRLRTQSRRMSSMLTGLLSYAKLEQKGDAIAPVDTAVLVNSIVDSLHLPVSFEVYVKGNWPEIETLEAPLDLIIRNLIENAIKHHDREEGVVIISCHEEGKALVFKVSDDGPGIAKNHQEAIFQPFVRLNEEDARGTGMGLALVKRAAQSVGAELSVLSAPENGRGCAMIVMWPRVLLTKL